MYFPGDPLLDYDPIFLSVRDPAGRARLISSFDWATTQEERALGYCFDIVVGGHLATPVDPPRDRRRRPRRRRSVRSSGSPSTGWRAGRLSRPGRPDALTIWGHVFDGAGEPVPDAVVEIYQAAPPGPARPGWRPSGARAPTPPACTASSPPNRAGSTTARPRTSTCRSSPAGLLQRLWTRCYFPDEAAANASDPVLQAIADGGRVATLIARPDPAGLRFDICLQGDHETVFFDW